MLKSLGQLCQNNTQIGNDLKKRNLDFCII